jgi:hypothetical protein
MKSIRETVRTLVEQLLKGTKAPVGHALQKAMEHGEAAYREMKSLPDRAADPERHDRCIRAIHAHAMAVARYIDNYRSYPPEPAETPAIGPPVDPETRQARERTGAAAAVVLQGFARG